MHLGLEGKRAIVTGASRGIGYETARLFLREGVRVLICARDGDKLSAARDALANETGGEVHGVQADMSVEADIARLVDAAKQQLGGVDILVNNAGTMYSGRFAVLTDESLKAQLETKLFGFMRAIRLVSPLMRAQKWGRIVNMIGGAGKEPDPYMFGSGMTNSALLNLTKSLSTELGEDNVLVNAVCPGWVEERAGREERGGGPAPGCPQERAQPLRQARGAGQRHRVPVLGARELHHRRVAQPRRRSAQGAVVAPIGAGGRVHRRRRREPGQLSLCSLVSAT